MKPKRKFIIGAGISGLIYHYYHPDFSIISKDVGGKLFNNYLSPTIFLHDCQETRKLLSDLGFPIKLRKHHIHYCYKSNLYNHISTKYKEIMVRKKLTLWDELHASNLHVPITDLTLSCKENFIPTFETDVNKVLEVLSPRVPVIQEEVQKITKDEVITNKSTYPYSQIVSSIPAPVFWKMYGTPKDMRSLPQSFILTDKPPSRFRKKDELADLTYFLDNDVPYTRVNKYSNNTYLYEFTGVVDIQQAKKLLPAASQILHCYVDYYGIVLSNNKNDPPPNTVFIGRFATWNHKNKIQDTIKVALKKNYF